MVKLAQTRIKSQRDWRLEDVASAMVESPVSWKTPFYESFVHGKIDVGDAIERCMGRVV